MSEAAVSSRRVAAVAVGFFLATLLLFSRGWGHEFVNYDDPDYVTSNPHVKTGLTAASMRWALTADIASNWHPLTWWSHQLDWTLFGDNPHGHHATSIVLHALNAALAFLVFWRLNGAVWPAATAAALFAWHPLRVESVGWIAERKDVLSGFFALLTLWAYVTYVERAQRPRAAMEDKRLFPAWGTYVVALVAFALGLMAKPMLVTVPCVLLLLDYWPLRRTGATFQNVPRLLIEKAPFFALVAISARVTYLVQQRGGSVALEVPLGLRMANACVAIPRYLGKFFWPERLAVLYPHPGHWPAVAVIGALLVIVGCTATVGWQAKRRPWLIVGWLWFLGMLVPVSGLVQVGLQSIADRYTYLPMLGVVLALVCVGREVLPARGRTWIVALVVSALAMRTWQQLGVWRDSLTLFDHTIAVAGNGNYLAYNNRGLALFKAGKVDEALADYQRSLAINPAWPEANNNLGYTLEQTGRAAEAIPFIQKALEAKPNQLEMHNNLGNALSDVGRLDEAIQQYEFVLARDPNHINALNGLGVTLAMQQKLPEAIARFERVLQIDPHNGSAHGNLGNVMAMQGRREEAIAHYQQALAAKPDDAQSLHNLANVLAEQGRLEEAAANYRHAIALVPNNPSAHANLGILLARMGRRDEAIRELQTALQQQPGYPPAQQMLGQLMQAGAGGGRK